MTSPPPVQANQDSSTNVIKMTVVGDPDQAAALATVAADTYIRNWRERTRLDPDREELASVKSDRYVQRPTPQNATKTMGMTSLALVGGRSRVRYRCRRDLPAGSAPGSRPCLTRRSAWWCPPSAVRSNYSGS